MFCCRRWTRVVAGSVGLGVLLSFFLQLNPKYLDSVRWSLKTNGTSTSEPLESEEQKHDESEFNSKSDYPEWVRQDEDAAHATSLHYRHPHNQSMRGKAFSISATHVRCFIKPLAMSAAATLTQSMLDDFVFVTAASEQFYNHSVALVAHIQQVFPKRTIVYYDLGLNSSHREEIQQYCNVVLRQADFNNFPLHVSEGFLYAWKPLVIADALKNFSGVFWVDSSIVFLANHLTDVFNQLMNNSTSNHGVLFFVDTGHGNIAVTHPQTYDYLPTNVTSLLPLRQFGAGVILFYKTHFVVRHVIRWFVYCALDEQCIAPDRNRFCDTTRLNSDHYIDCHRFDQSVVNVILANVFKYRDYEYRAIGGNKMLYVQKQRQHWQKELIFKCTNDSRIGLIVL